jgi:Holliday junction DNA helicase RuvA
VIAFVRGTVAQVVGDSLVIDLGSVGVTVQCTAATVLSVRHGEHIELMTSMVVREDGWTLYGFADPDERTVFEQVQTVSGIGPRIAIFCSAARPRRPASSGRGRRQATVMRARHRRKGAQRLILELKDRIGPAWAVAACRRRRWPPETGRRRSLLG